MEPFTIYTLPLPRCVSMKIVAVKGTTEYIYQVEGLFENMEDVVLTKIKKESGLNGTLVYWTDNRVLKYI